MYGHYWILFLKNKMYFVNFAFCSYKILSLEPLGCLYFRLIEDVLHKLGGSEDKVRVRGGEVLLVAHRHLPLLAPLAGPGPGGDVMRT